MPNETSYVIKTRLNSPNLRRQTQFMLYKTLIKPIHIYIYIYIYIYMEANVDTSTVRIETYSEILKECRE